MDNTLERLRAMQRQNKPPTARPNPAAATAPTVGGTRDGDITASLNATQSVQLVVTFDETGTARIADVGDADRGRLSDPRFRAFAERAMRAVRDPRCANLPIPKTDLGKRGTLTFRFKP